MPGSVSLDTMAKRLAEMGAAAKRQTAVLEDHLIVCDERAARDAADFKQTLGDETERNNRFKEKVLEHQMTVIDALQIGPAANGKKTLATLTRPHPWTIAGIIAALVLALPLSYKIIDTVLTALAHALK